MTRVRILLADAQPKVRFALRVLLERQPGMDIKGEAANADDLLALMVADCPELVLLGWELPGLATIGSVSVVGKILHSRGLSFGGNENLAGRTDSRFVSRFDVSTLPSFDRALRPAGE